MKKLLGILVLGLLLSGNVMADSTNLPIICKPNDNNYNSKKPYILNLDQSKEILKELFKDQSLILKRNLINQKNEIKNKKIKCPRNSKKIYATVKNGNPKEISSRYLSLAKSWNNISHTKRNLDGRGIVYTYIYILNKFNNNKYDSFFSKAKLWNCWVKDSLNPEHEVLANSFNCLARRLENSHFEVKKTNQAKLNFDLFKCTHGNKQSSYKSYATNGRCLDFEKQERFSESDQRNSVGEYFKEFIVFKNIKESSQEYKIVKKKQDLKIKKELKPKVTKLVKNYNTNSNKGKSFQGKNGVVYEGWSKQQFCKQEYAAGWDSAWCRKRSSYFQNGIEVNEWKGKPGRFAIFKDVTSPINTNAWDNKSFGNGTFHAIAYGWTDVQKIIDQLENKVSNPKTINFTIKDKKEQCEVIGFKPQTEKFADCVLRLVELDVKKQQSNVALSNNNSTNNAIVKQLEIQNKQLERQRYDEGTKFLFDLSRQLSQPKSSSWSTCSYIDFGHGMGKVKCN